ncbi:MAG: HAD family phosphatase [Oscillospiraceae bacterium]|nr:HAD family phosphatase [Oscillospiraceae bacterium]
MNPTPKLIALDLDGTLLTYEKQITPRTYAALEEAAAQGHYIVPATGRALHALPDPVKALPFVRYAITINGACVSDGATGEKLLRCEIDRDRALEIMEFAKNYDCMYDCYWNDTGWSERAFLERIDYFNRDEAVRKLILQTRRPVDDLFQKVRAEMDTVQKVQLCFREIDERNAAWMDIATAFPDVAATASFRNNLEINHKMATKGNALRFLARHLGLNERDTIAFGDSSNDLPMLQSAGVGVAMGNADPAVKAVCSAVTDTNENDGVAVYLEEHILV